MKARAHFEWLDRSTVAVFFVALWLPLVWSVIERDREVSEGEKRELSALPRLSVEAKDWRAFPGDMTAYYDDHLGFRDALIRGHSYLKIRWLGVSPNDQVIVGKEGWLFLGDQKAVDQYRGIARFTPAELRRWRQVLVEWRDRMARSGVAFLVVFVPNKHSVYPEFMPDSLPRLSGETQLAQLVRFLEEQSDLPVLDLRGVLLAAKARGPVYHRTDSHWNDVGAYAAYRAILSRLSEQLPALEGSAPVAVRYGELDGPGMGLAGMLGLDGLLGDRYVFLRPIQPRADVPPAERPRHLGLVRRQLPLVLGTGDPALPRAVMFRDSFANALLPFLSENFEQIVYLWDRGVQLRLVALERPDVVIFEIAERFIGKPPKSTAGSRPRP